LIRVHIEVVLVYVWLGEKGIDAPELINLDSVRKILVVEGVKVLIDVCRG
jgi:hypothetical protein